MSRMMVLTIRKRLRLYPITILLTSFLGSIFSPVYAEEKPYQQDVLVTAYYSPVPDQCCYFRGSYDEEIIFNGNGISGADGTKVYEGMLAAPSSYSFGTRIHLPGLGVGTVHDRGGRIIEWGDSVHRIDVWMGTGEEGLKRALAWGARRMTATIYPLSSAQRAETLSFDGIQGTQTMLAGLERGDPHILMKDAVFGERSYRVRVLQSSLKKLGYFDYSITGEFGPITQDALKRFLTAHSIPGDGKSVGSFTAALMSVTENMKANQGVITIDTGLTRGMKSQQIVDIKRRLRFLGFYKGRTSTLFDTELKDAVIRFQQSRSILSSKDDPSAGRIGPATKRALTDAWKEKMALMSAHDEVMKQNIQAVIEKNAVPKKTITQGDRGSHVRTLQKSLVTLGYLTGKDVTGFFGERTRIGIIRYQKDQKIITKDTDHGVGVFGNATRSAMKKSLVEREWKKVREG